MRKRFGLFCILILLFTIVGPLYFGSALAQEKRSPMGYLTDATLIVDDDASGLPGSTNNIVAVSMTNGVAVYGV